MIDDIPLLTLQFPWLPFTSAAYWLLAEDTMNWWSLHAMAYIYIVTKSQK